jgi:hypothetical protein
MRFPIAALLTAGLVTVFAANAFAGRIFGDIKIDGKPIPEGVKVRVKGPAPASGAASADTTATDKFGSYKLMIKEEGKCVLTVVYDKQPLEIQVFSNKEATRYDLIIEKKDGKLTLRRK